MKRKALLHCVGISAVLLAACNPEETDVSVTQELKKIETTWDNLSPKDESSTEPKVETTATPRMISEMKEQVRSQYNAYLQRSPKSISNARIGNWVGVVKNSAVAGSAGCNGYDELEINMDCEDNNSKTTWLEYDAYYGGGSPHFTYRPGGWWVGGNATFRFCIVPGDGFHRFLGSAAPTNGKYALLRVTTNFRPDAEEVSRRFDNEDRRNANSAYIRRGNQTINVEGNSSDNDNSVYRTYIDDNSYLSFHLFGIIPDWAVGPNDQYITDFPDIGFSYGVFGDYFVPDYLELGLAKIDDEDNNNANYYFNDEGADDDQIDLWYKFRGIIEGRNGDVPSVAIGNQNPISGKDTYVHIARVK